MTEEGTLGSGAPEAPRQAGAPLPLGTPAPLPIQGDARRSSGLRAGWIAALVIVIVSTVCCCSWLAASWIGGVVGEPPGGLDPYADLTAPTQPDASVWWSGGGRFVVLQAVGVDDVQEVHVREIASGETRTLKGYRVVGVEPHAPRVWLVPDDRVMRLDYDSGVTTTPLTDIAWDGIDAPPAELLAWRIDAREDPRADVDARWTPWPGAAGYAASVEIDVNKGACPGAIRFSKVGSSLNAWSAKVPTSVVSFEPIGWSPSGEYFAVISQSEPTRTARVDREFLDAQHAVVDLEGAETTPLDPEETGSAYPMPTVSATVVVFSAKDGSVAAKASVTVPIRSANSGPAQARWMGSSEELMLLDQKGASDGGTDIRLLRLAPGGAAVSIDASPTPWAAGEYDSIWLAGAEGASMLVASSNVDASGVTDIYRVTATGSVEHLGATIGEVAARWSDEGGLLSLQSALYSGGSWRVYRSGAGGGGRTEVLSALGPDQSGL